jgi:nucleoside-diphosphate-sugar epimerase
MKSAKKILLMGAGWLGLPLAKKLHEVGHEVWASTRSENKPKEESISQYLLFNTAQPDFTHFPEAQFFDHAVWLIPPGRSEESRAAFVPAIHAFCDWGKEVKGSVI